MQKSATLSDDRKYRYNLWRIWDKNKPFAVFIGLNPSTADEYKDDNTIRRCIGLAKSWSLGGIYMLNLFAYRATNYKKMMLVQDPVGDENDYYLQSLPYNAGIIIASWGNNGNYMNRATQVRSMFNDLHCLALNKSGEPKHPLYVKALTIPILFN